MKPIGTHTSLALYLLVLFIAPMASSCNKSTVAQKPVSPTTSTIPTTPPTPTSPATLAIQNDGTVLMKVGQSVTLSPSMSMDYVRVVNDSRCPVGAQCIWAGEITIELKLHSGADQQSFNLTDRANTTAVMGMQIELLSIDRANTASFRVKKI